MGDTPIELLRDVDLLIRAGEYVAIAGASGSGKTLLLLLSELERPATGQVVADGIDHSTHGCRCNGRLAARSTATKGNADARMGWLVIIGSFPIAALGLTFQDAIETYLRNLYLTATMLIGFALVLGAADRYGKRNRSLDQMSWRDGILFGFAQAMALIPGVSRSGGTITAGLLMGYTREAAARYSFLRAIPAVMASGFFQLYKS